MVPFYSSSILILLFISFDFILFISVATKVSFARTHTQNQLLSFPFDSIFLHLPFSRTHLAFFFFIEFRALSVSNGGQIYHNYIYKEKKNKNEINQNVLTLTNVTFYNIIRRHFRKCFN